MKNVIGLDTRSLELAKNLERQHQRRKREDAEAAIYGRAAELLRSNGYSHLLPALRTNLELAWLDVPGHRSIRLSTVEEGWRYVLDAGDKVYFHPCTNEGRWMYFGDGTERLAEALLQAESAWTWFKRWWRS